MAHTASIVICTRNRAEVLPGALDSCLAQSYEPLEILVIDDASTDRTEKMIKSKYPSIRYMRMDKNEGIARLRQIGLEQAVGEYVFSIDDDAFYTDRSTIAEAVAYFDGHPSVAAVALPYIEPYREGPCSPHLAGREGEELRLKSFVSCAYGIRRERALQVGGYRALYYYRGEEKDLCIRLHEADADIVFIKTDPVVHLYSDKRSWGQMSPYGIRNTLLFSALNVPQPYVLPVMLRNSVQLFLYKLSWRNAWEKIRHLFSGWLACSRYISMRRPVSLRTYRRFTNLPAHGALPYASSEVPERLRVEVTAE